jgi:hypothetical protein
VDALGSNTNKLSEALKEQWGPEVPLAMLQLLQGCLARPEQRLSSSTVLIAMRRLVKLVEDPESRRATFSG